MHTNMYDRTRYGVVQLFLFCILAGSIVDCFLIHDDATLLKAYHGPRAKNSKMCLPSVGSARAGPPHGLCTHFPDSCTHDTCRSFAADRDMRPPSAPEARTFAIAKEPPQCSTPGIVRLAPASLRGHTQPQSPRSDDPSTRSIGWRGRGVPSCCHRNHQCRRCPAYRYYSYQC
jgi:hypothetical protein